MANVDPSKRFWMVYGVGQGAPTFRHPVYGAALDEAKRLARQNPDIAFVVLEAVSCVIKHEFVTTHFRGGLPIADDDIPF